GLYYCRCCITYVSWRMVRTNYLCIYSYRALHHSHFTGCKATRFKNEMDDNVVHDLLCICCNWVDFFCFRCDIWNRRFTNCNLGLLVRRNVN
ncbi:unnamed protein product, partial [Schistosoma haematobium]